MGALDYLRVTGLFFILAVKWLAPILACFWADDRETADDAKYQDVFVRDLGCEAY